MIQGFYRIYNSLLRGDSGTEDQQPQSSTWLQYCFIFAAIWGLCQTLNQESREKFDEFYRTLLTGNDKDYPKPKGFKLNKNQLFPEKGTVFDYICDKRNNQWVFWIDIVDREHQKISPTAKVNEIMIPTDETARQIFFLKMYMTNDYPCMFLGPT